MSTEIATQQNNSLSAIWNNTDEVRKQFAKDLSDIEFKFFVGLGKNLGANPFTREIWAVKYGTAPASIFLGRDFYRKKAQEQPDYDGHYSEAVYSNDDFSVESGVVKHKFKLIDRGVLIAAYSIVKRKGISQSFYVLVNFSEYNLNQSLWKTKPESQLKKVAESQALRGAYQGIFGGTYDESEAFKSEGTDGKTTDAIVMISEVQKEDILSLIANDVITSKERNPIVNRLEKFDFQEAEKCLIWLKKEVDFRESVIKSEKE